MGSSLLVPTGQPGPMGPGEYVPTAPPNQVSFKSVLANPPSQLYVQLDDRLTIVSAALTSAESIIVSGRMLSPGGVVRPFLQTFKLGTAAAQNWDIQLGEGWLLGCSVAATQATSRGQTYVRAVLYRGSSALPLAQCTQVLFSDYVTQSAASGYPYGRIVAPLEGPGQLTWTTPSNPTTGNDPTDVLVPPLGVARLRLFTGTLITSSGVANRTVQIGYKLPNNNVILLPPVVSQAASLSVTYTAADGIANGLSVDTTKAGYALPTGMLIPNSGFIKVATSLLQGTDRWQSLSYQIEQWVNI